MTPSEALFAAGAHRDPVTVGDVLRATPPDPAALTVAGAAERIAAGRPWGPEVRELLDALAMARDDADLSRLVTDEPVHLSAQVDAYLAALVEHQCSRRAVPAPDWVLAPGRFLDAWWWPGPTRALDAVAVRESPAAFRRRGIFIGATTLHRV